MKKTKGINLTDRDREVILMVYNYDSCGYAHVYKRLFSGITYAKFYERMRELIDNGYIVAHRLPAISGIGAGKNLLNVGRKGFYELHDLLGPGKLRRPRKISRAIPADHQHGICDFRVDLELGCLRTNHQETDPEVYIYRWTNERELRGKTDRIPDAEFELVILSNEIDPHATPRILGQQAFRLELDRGTIDDSERMIKRLVDYISGDDRSPVLWVVPDQKRADKLSEWTLTAAQRVTIGADPTMIWITTAGSDPLGDVWQIVGGPSCARLTP